MNDCHTNCENALYKNAPTTFTKKSTSILSSIAILLLPKCPLCIIAYTSSISLCGINGVVTNTEHHIGWGAYLSLAICVLITALILVTFRNKKNKLPYFLTASLSCIGTLLIYWANFKTLSMPQYYIGAALLVIAALVYSELYSKLKHPFNLLNR